METLLGLLAAVGAGIVIFAVLYAFPRPRRAVAWLGHAVFRAGLAACRAVSVFADAVIDPRLGRVAPLRLMLWLVVSLLPLALFFALNLPQARAALPTMLAGLDFGYLLIAGGAVQALVLIAALVTAHEDYDVMDGIVAIDRRRIGGTHAVRLTPTVVIGFALALVYAAATFHWLTAIDGLTLLERAPGTGLPAADALLAVLWALPTRVLLQAIDWAGGVDTEAVFNDTLAAHTFYVTVFSVGTLLLVGAASLLFHMWWQLRRIVTELGEGREGERAFMSARLRLGPPFIKRGVLNAALTSHDPLVQKRLLEAARDSGIIAFPQVFVRNLEDYGEDVRDFGLERALELYRQRVGEFDRAACEAILRRAARHLRRAKLSTDTMKRLVRLMVAVLTNKRDVVKLDEKEKKAISEAAARQLKNPRSEGDPAFRGLLQDLRMAVARLPSDKPEPLPQPANDWVKTIKPAASGGPAARPENPARTATR